ncbi:hypothetical protein ACFSS8_20440 [Paracoccus kondratievae]
MTMDLVFNWGDPVIGVNRTYLCSNIRQGIIWSNTQQYCNEEVDQLLNAAGDEPDLTKRKQLYAQAFGQITADIPIHFLNEIPITRSGLRRCRTRPSRSGGNGADG